MINYQREALAGFMDEAKPLLESHYRELTLNKEQVKLEPVWQRYLALEKQGSFVLVTAREDGRLVGYSAFFIQTHIHYAGLLVAHNDVLYLHPDFRKGLCGVKLIRHSEQCLKDLGVAKITWHIKAARDFSAILQRLGYGKEEIVMGKLINSGG